MAIAFALLAAAEAHAQSQGQSLPSPQQAEVMLRTRPELAAQLRQRIQSSGLSADQVRARLRAAGYPEALLDQVMGGRDVAGTASAATADSMLAAVRALGIVDSADASVLRRMALASGAESAPNAGTSRGTATSTSRENTSGAPGGAAYTSDGSTIFGLDLFAQSTSLFDANAAGPVDASYRLGAGDQLVLILTGDVEQAYTLDVTREGFIIVPVVGQVPVASLTLGELEAVLRPRLQRVYSGIGKGNSGSTRFSVSVARLRSNQVYVLGDVAQPGSYRISSAGTALTALYAAGGPTERGTLRQLAIRRRGQPDKLFDAYDYLLRGNAAGDVRLENGDVLFVPPHGPRVRVHGAVLRAATYELKPGETMSDVVTAAGGFTPDASRRRLRVQRIVPPSQRTAEGNDRIVLDVAVPDGAGTALAAVRVEAGDDVEVMRVADRVRGRVVVRGNVWQPGSLGLTPGLTLAQAIQHAGGLKPDTYLGRILVSRLKPDSTREQLRTALRDQSGATVDVITLQEDDEVTVYGLTEFRASRYVAITGAVSNSGQYLFRDGMTLRDLILEAGGLTPSASLAEVEIARLPGSRQEGRLAIPMRMPLDSSYVTSMHTGAAPKGEVPLEAFDNVLVLRQPNWQTQTTVVLTGEVQYPGVYTLVAKDERLSDLIKRAGGLTSSAFAAGISFTRHDGKLGRVGIDLPGVLNNPRDRDNLLLLPGDSVDIPRFNALVEVAGAVNSPLAVPYEPGRTLDHYVSAAGGMARLADTRRAYVRQANGKVESRHRYLLFFSSTPKPGPGSRVIVPARDAADKRDFTQLVGSVAQVLGGIVTIVVVLSRTK